MKKETKTSDELKDALKRMVMRTLIQILERHNEEIKTLKANQFTFTIVTFALAVIVAALVYLSF